MISYEDQTITLSNKTEPIKAWQVWWSTPHGLMASFEEVKVYCSQRDFSVDVAKPVPVAVGATLYEPAY